MNAILEQAAAHWPYLAPLLTAPENEDDYDTLVRELDDLLDLMGDDAHHPLRALAAQMGDLIAAYDARHYPIAPAPGHEVLRSLMLEHKLTQAELPEVGAQSVVSSILNGKRQLNLRQIRALSQRFNVPADVFL